MRETLKFKHLVVCLEGFYGLRNKCPVISRWQLIYFCHFQLYIFYLGFFWSWLKFIRKGRTQINLGCQFQKWGLRCQKIRHRSDVCVKLSSCKYQLNVWVKLFISIINKSYEKVLGGLHESKSTMFKEKVNVERLKLSTEANKDNK